MYLLTLSLKTPTIRVARERANTIKASKKDKDIPISENEQPEGSEYPDRRVEADDASDDGNLNANGNHIDMGPQMPADSDADDDLDVEAQTFQDQDHQPFEPEDDQVIDDEDIEEVVKPPRSKVLTLFTSLEFC